MTNYASMAKRIRACATGADFDRVQKSLYRLYRAGAFTARELMRLDVLIMERITKTD